MGNSTLIPSKKYWISLRISLGFPSNQLTYTFVGQKNISNIPLFSERHQEGSFLDHAINSKTKEIA